MAEYMTNTEDLTTVADAIRAKGKTTEPLVFPEGFKTAVEGIKGGFPNGTEWTKGTGQYNFISLAKTPEAWVAGTYTSGICTSEDGKTWTPSGAKGRYVKLAYYYGTIVGTRAGKGILYSKDNGKTFNPSNLSTGTYDEFVTNERGKWFAGGLSGLAESEDGVNWTAVQPNGTPMSYVQGIATNGELWVAVTYESVYTSNDGENWTESTPPFEPACICAHKGMFIAGSGAGEGVFYSSDGKQWVDGTSALGGGGFETLTSYENRVIAAGPNGIITSADGKTWERSNLTYGGFKATGGACGILVAGGTSGIFYSRDGKLWENAAGGSKGCNQLENRDGQWVAACSDGPYYSVTWEPS